MAKFKAFVHSTPEKFKNGVFDLKTYQMLFSVHATPEKSENATINGDFRFVFVENSGIDCEQSLFSSKTVGTNAKQVIV